MTKIVNWGHWVAGGVFAAMGLKYFFEGVLSVPTLIRILRGESFSYYISGGVVLWIPFLLCAWGILQWRRWGHTLALVLCSILMLSVGHWLTSVRMQSLNPYEILVTVLTGCIFLWLLLPGVRTLYWRGNVTA